MNNGNKQNTNIPDLGLDFDNYSGNELLDGDLTEEDLLYLEEQERELQEQLDYERNKRAREEKDEVNERLRRAKEEANKDYKTANSNEKENSSSKKSDLDKDDTKEKEREKKEEKNAQKETEQNSLTATTNKSSTEANSRKEAPKGEKKDVVGKNKEGNELTKPKTKFDKLKDQKRLAGARLGKASNTINRARALKHEISHPLSAAGSELKKAGVKAGKKAATAIGKGTVSAITKLIAAIGALGPIGILFILVIVLVIIVCIIAIVLGSSLEQQNNWNGIGYYDAPCQEITVIGTSNHPDSGTFSVEDYVAGVVQNEVGFWDNLVVDEVFAVAARTYVFKTAGETCTIENSTRYQTFTSNPGDTAKTSAMNTRGMVITDENGYLLLTQYDALAVKEVTSTDYILKQKDQHIPKSWIESHINSSTLSYYANHNHGNGISQWGARYLAEQGKSSTEIISYYLDNAAFKNTYVGEGLEGVPEYPLVGNNGSILRGRRLDNFLIMEGSSLEYLNGVIRNNVDKAGRGTRAGVVSAAVTLIGEMNKFGVKLPYVYGGGHGSISTGAEGSWGSGSGLDCSGFISWAIYNGGVGISASDSSSFASLGTVVDLGNEPVLKPGDIIWRPRTSGKVGHVAMVVGYDKANGQYLTAEALGSDYGVLFHKRSFNASGYKGISMENYYNSH